jgi:hypothetical protein
MNAAPIHATLVEGAGIVVATIDRVAEANPVYAAVVQGTCVVVVTINRGTFTFPVLTLIDRAEITVGARGLIVRVSTPGQRVTIVIRTHVTVIAIRRHPTEAGSARTPVDCGASVVIVARGVVVPPWVGASPAAAHVQGTRVVVDIGGVAGGAVVARRVRAGTAAANVERTWIAVRGAGNNICSIRAGPTNAHVLRARIAVTGTSSFVGYRRVTESEDIATPVAIKVISTGIAVARARMAVLCPRIASSPASSATRNREVKSLIEKRPGRSAVFRWHGRVTIWRGRGHTAVGDFIYLGQLQRIETHDPDRPRQGRRFPKGALTSLTGLGLERLG